MASTEIIFAQRLASNERKIREKAIKKLKKYLEIRSKSKKGFTKEDFLKIWKGLHYCLWMQDKPVIQEELVQKITQLVHLFGDEEQTFLFMTVFFITEAREWPTIDKWRMDKFMMLIRQFLRQSLQYIQAKRWSYSVLHKLDTMIQDTILNIKDKKIAFGYQAYFSLIYLQELKLTGLKKASTETICHCLQPFIRFISQSNQKEVIIDIVKKIIDPIIKEPVKTFRQTAQLQGNAVNEVLADKFFNFGRSPSCTAWHRRLFYNLVKRIRDKQDELLNIPKPDYDLDETLTDDVPEATAQPEDIDFPTARKEKKLSTPKSDKKKLNKSPKSVKSRNSIQNNKAAAQIDSDNTNTDPKCVDTETDQLTNGVLDSNGIVSTFHDTKSPSKSNKRKAQLPNDNSFGTPSSPSKKSKLKSDVENKIKGKSPKVGKNNKTPVMETQSSSLLKSFSESPKQPDENTSSQKKKVVFDMKKNTALKFKKTMAVSPLPPYSPNKKPEQGILKSPPTSVLPVTYISPKKAGKKKDTPKVQLFASKASNRRSLTPSFKKHSPAAGKRMTRSRASDFF